MKLKPINWVERGSFNKYGSDRIFKIHEGNGENLLILQGLETTSLDWNNVIELLTKRFKILLPDLLGLGFSDKPKRYNYSLEDSISQIVYLLKKNRINSLHILAHDFGIEITSRLIKKIKEEINGIKILSISLILDGSLELPKSYTWNIKNPFWIKLQSKTTNSVFTKPKLLNVNRHKDDLGWKFTNKDLIPIGLANLETRSEKKQIFEAIHQTFAPICIFLTTQTKINQTNEIEEIKEKLPKAKLFYFPEFIGRFPIEENSCSLTENFLKFYNTI